MMLGCFLPVARSSSPFLSADVRKEERDAAERAIVDTANKDDIGDVVAPPPSNRVGPEIQMDPEMGREHKKIQLHESPQEFNPWTQPAPEDVAYEDKWDKEFPDPPPRVLAEAAREFAKESKGKERPDFMQKVFDNGKNFAVAERQGEDLDARTNAEDETLNGDTTMAGMNNAFKAEEKAAKNHDDAFHGGHDDSPKMVADDEMRFDPLTLHR